MRRSLLLAALAALPHPSLAQSMPGMPGMKMPAKSTPQAKPKPVPRRAPARPTRPTNPQAAPMPGMDMTSTMPPADVPPPAAPMATDMPAPSLPDAAPPMAGMDMDMGKITGTAGMTMGAAAFAEGSGTARNPGAERMIHGLHVTSGDWKLMAHGNAWGVYTEQSGPRGSDEAFVESMAMLQAQRDLGGGTTLKLRSMISLEPLMGAKGYPSLFATGETADGVTPLIDRQHPHDLFMELSARLDVPLGKDITGFIYGGPVAEPALGPSAFMHRRSAQFLPLAPITHHWFDSTHITFGVITVGVYDGRWQIEGSAFRGREPDQDRWDIETPALDSWSVRATWNPSPHWSAQASYGRLQSPEALERGVDEARTTASLQYARGDLSVFAGFSAKNRLPGRTLTAWIGEANWDLGRHHTLFGRIENVANDELFPDRASLLHDRPFRITRGELGYAYRLKLTSALDAAIGGSGVLIAKPAVLDAAYGNSAAGWTAFVKISLGR